MSSFKIRLACESDAPEMCRIYNYYILNTPITFETAAVSPLEMQKRIKEKNLKHDWIVGEVDGEIAGYAYYGPYRERTAYRQTVESTIYLDRAQLGRGYGKELYSRLIQSALERGYCQIIGVIALPNPASTGLHARLGFREVGVLKKVGYKFDRYIDTGIWQKELCAGICES